MQNLALFDFDGTITFSDTFTPFVYRAATPLRLALGKVLLTPLIAAYQLRVLSASALRSVVVRLAFRGRREAEIREAGSRYGRSELPGVIRPAALERIRWHQQLGDVVVVVSASLDVYLSEWCRGLGVELICSELEAEGGVLTGRYRDGDCTGAEKSRRVRQKYDTESYQVIYAYGDTREDAQLLALAHRRYYRWQEVSQK